MVRLELAKLMCAAHWHIKVANTGSQRCMNGYRALFPRLPSNHQYESDRQIQQPWEL